MSGSVLNFLSFFIKKLLSRGIFPFIYIIHFIATITSRCKTDAQLNFNRDRGAWHDICPAKENLNKKIIWLLSPSNFCLLLLAGSRRRSEGLILIYFISMINFHPLNTSLFKFNQKCTTLKSSHLGEKFNWSERRSTVSVKQGVLKG